MTTHTLEAINRRTMIMRLIDSGMSKRNVADRVGVTPQYVSHVLTRRRLIELRCELRRIA
jgi:predicted transcriptional regulator